MSSSSETKLTFGPPSSQWVYDKSNKTYDLTRQSSSSPSTATTLKVSTTYGPPSTSILLSSPKSALVVVDMQNFFLHPRCRAHPTGLAAIPPLQSVITKCRETGVKVVWLNWGLTDDDLGSMPAGVLRGFASQMIQGPDGDGKFGLGEDLGGGMGRTLCEGAWNSDIYGEFKEKGYVREGEGGDVFVAKNRMSGLWCEEQPLWKWLKEDEDGREVQTLLFAGVNTDQCVLGTLTNAYNAGWDCIMIEDCCATTTPGATEVCAYNIGKNYGFVINSRTFVAAATS